MGSTGRPYVLEIWFSRRLTRREVRWAAVDRAFGYGFTPDRRRAVAVVRAGSLEAAFPGTWADLADEAGLPVDVVWTLFPDRDAMVRASFSFAHETAVRLRDVAAARGQTEQDLLIRLISDAVGHAERARELRLDKRVAALLAEAAPEEVLRSLSRCMARSGEPAGS